MVTENTALFAAPRITCPNCLGSGFAHTTTGESYTCPVCGGEKMVQPFTRPDGKKTCKEHVNHLHGYVRKSGPGWSFRCSICFAFVENIGKFEIGESRKPPTSRRSLGQDQRARILERERFRCLACGRGTEDGVLLELAHVLSVSDYDGFKERGIDMSEIDVNADYNVFACCNECNGGQWKYSLNPLLYVRLIQAMFRRAK